MRETRTKQCDPSLWSGTFILLIFNFFTYTYTCNTFIYIHNARVAVFVFVVVFVANVVIESFRSVRGSVCIVFCYSCSCAYKSFFSFYHSISRWYFLFHSFSPVVSCVWNVQTIFFHIILSISLFHSVCSFFVEKAPRQRNQCVLTELYTHIYIYMCVLSIKFSATVVCDSFDGSQQPHQHQPEKRIVNVWIYKIFRIHHNFGYTTNFNMLLICLCSSRAVTSEIIIYKHNKTSEWARSLSRSHSCDSLPTTKKGTHIYIHKSK